MNPALKPLKSCIGKILRRAQLRALRPRFHDYSMTEFDGALASSGFRKISGQTLGFGPFTLFNQTLLNDHIGWKVHVGMQRLADDGALLLRSSGLIYLVLARKPEGG
jgi:hypothetical protein